MSNLRWIERDGKMVLQENPHPNFTDWSDVPTHQEPKLEHSHRCASIQGTNLNCNCFLAYPPDVKKVTVEDDLTDVLCDADKDWSSATYLPMAKAAIEFFKARMPKPLPGYEDAFKDVRLSLFGEA